MATGKGEGTPASGGGITLAELKSMCKYHGWRDTTSEGESALTRFINNTVNLLSQLAPWPEFLKRDGSVAMIASTAEYILDEAGINSIGTVERADNTLPLDEIGIEDWLHHTTTSQTGSPNAYAIEPTGAMTLKMLVHPTPTEVETLYYTYYRRPTELSGASDGVDWPDDRIWLIEEALEKRLAAGKKDTTGWSLHSADFMQKVYTALGNARGSYKPIKTRTKSSSKDIRIRDTWWRIVD